MGTQTALLPWHGGATNGAGACGVDDGGANDANHAGELFSLSPIPRKAGQAGQERRPSSHGKALAG